MGDFTMPSLGADMEAGVVTEWLVKPGDEVHRGDIVAVIETEKSTIEIEVFENGVIDDIVVPVGEEVPVGTVLAHVRAGPPAGAPAPPAAAPPVATPAALVPEAEHAEVGLKEAPVLSPVIRHLAQELEVDLAHLPGTGVDGRITRADVERAAHPHGPAPAPPKTVPRRPSPPAAREPGRIRSSPYARRLARDLGVPLNSLAGSGPGGSVVARDVRAAAAPAPATSPRPAVTPRVASGSAERKDAMRRAIGALMARSKREIPHYYLSTTIDVSAAADWLERTNLERPVTARLVLPVLLIKATALAVRKVPETNGFFLDDAFAPSAAVHVGVAISVRSGGVIAPAIHDTDRLEVGELMARLSDLVGRARGGRLRASEMSDPTITVTNLGDLGVEAVFGVIYPPQVALVGFGRVTDRAVAKDGLLGVRPCVTATLSADHRASDGHRGGRFLAEIDRLLQEPETL
jgi:pyruvate dehydrogenase E2 component (dihydrolipoamide acetyltransferase)